MQRTNCLSARAWRAAWRSTATSLLLILFVGASAQNSTRQIRGNVVDSNGLSLSHATIYAKKSNQRTMSDDKGQFVLKVSATDLIVVSRIGYKDVSVPVQAQNEVVI